ncbi:MAG: hypothetical protein CMJ78_05845 [Planctomycetaceae bacterium]|nr:hypothetical protein [Planctomycetaceae bacterium]
MICSWSRGEKYALLVGINDYQGDISPLRYCVADVEAFGQALVETAGFKSDNVYLMTCQMTGRRQPTHVNVIRQLSLLSERVKPEDTFIFYFSGHGITKSGQSFLLTTNSDTTTKDTLTITAVDLNQAKEILSRIQAQQLLTVIDACRNDPDSGRGEEDNLLTNDFSRGFKIKRDQGQAETPGVSATLYACAVGERAYEWPEKQHGVFSYYLLEGLNGKAANTTGEVVVSDLALYTNKKVSRWVKENKAKKQTPWLEKSGSDSLVLAEDVLSEQIQVEIVETKSTLSLGSNPSGATVYIDQQKVVGKTPIVLSIDTGITRQKRIEVGLKLDGYETLIMKVKLDAGEYIKLENVKLSKINLAQKRKLQINSYPTKAGIYLDHVLVGQTPFQTDIDLNSHRLRLSLTDHKDWYKQIPSVSSHNFRNYPTIRSINYDAHLFKIPDKPQKGNLLVKSNPAGAKISFQSNLAKNLDGIDQSTRTPTTVRNLSTGVYRIIFQSDGYKNSAKTVTVEGGKTAEIEVDLIPVSRKGNLIVSSNPAGANIYLNGIYQSKRTPTTLRGLDIGSHKITLELDDYESFTRTVRIKEKITVEITIDLVPRQGEIVVSSKPVGASIYLDGIYQARRTPTTLRCSAGLHTVTLKRSGYQNFTQSVDVEKDRALVVSAELISLRTKQSNKSSISGPIIVPLSRMIIDDDFQEHPSKMTQGIIGSVILIGTVSLVLWQADVLPLDTLSEIWDQWK